MPQLFYSFTFFVTTKSHSLVNTSHFRNIFSSYHNFLRVLCHLSDRHNRRSACLKFNGRSSGSKGKRSAYSIDDSLFINHHPFDLSLLRYDDHCLAMYGSSDLIPPDMGRRIITEFKGGFPRIGWI